MQKPKQVSFFPRDQIRRLHFLEEDDLVSQGLISAVALMMPRGDELGGGGCVPPLCQGRPHPWQRGHACSRATVHERSSPARTRGKQPGLSSRTNIFPIRGEP